MLVNVNRHIVVLAGNIAIGESRLMNGDGREDGVTAEIWQDRSGDGAEISTPATWTSQHSSITIGSTVLIATDV